MKTIKRNCLYCDEIFIPTRRDKMCCSHQCSSLFSIKKRKNKIIINKKIIDGKKQCRACLKFKDLSLFYGKKIKQANCIQCLSVKRASINYNENLYDEVYKFIYNLKLKNYYADIIDIYKLVDIYDRIYLTDSLPKINDIEASCCIMLDKVVKWYNINKLNRINSH